MEIPLAKLPLPLNPWPRKECERREGGREKGKPGNVNSPSTPNEQERRPRPIESIARVQVPLHLDHQSCPFQAQARSYGPPQSAIRGTSLIVEPAPGRFPSPHGGGHVRGCGDWTSLNKNRKGKAIGKIACCQHSGTPSLQCKFSNPRMPRGLCECKLGTQGRSRGVDRKNEGDSRDNVLTFGRGWALVYPSDERQSRIRYHVVTRARFPFQCQFVFTGLFRIHDSHHLT